MIKWLFFDLGSTLIDESDCLEFRVVETLKQPNAPDRSTFENRMVELAKQNKLPYKDAAKEFGLEIIKWPKHLEKLYNGVPELLKVHGTKMENTEEYIKEPQTLPFWVS